MRTKSQRPSRPRQRPLRLEPLEDRRLLDAGSLVINEFMANNNTTLADGDGNYWDWIEIHNPTASAVSLSGWHLTDDRTDLTQWPLPDISLAGGGYLVVFASGQNVDDYVDGGGNYHTNFKLSGSEGEDLLLVQPDGVTYDDTFLDFPPQSADVSYGIGSDGTGPYFFDPATPRQPNGTGYQTVADTKFSVDRGFYDAPFQLVITTETPGATIRYTTDGSEPTATTGTAYQGPIVVEGTTTLRAAAFKTGFQSTDVDTQTYVFLDDVLTQSGTPEGWPSGSLNGQILDYDMDPDIVNDPQWDVEAALTAIPSLSIVTDTDNLFNASTGIYVNADKEGWERPVSLELIYPPDASGPGFPDGADDGFQVEGGLRIRGGKSWRDDNPKHSFRMVFRGEYGDAKLKYPLFGDEGVDEFDKIDFRTAQNNSWNWFGDPRNTFLREVYARDSQADMGQPYTKSRYYHLYLNGQYWGLYQTQERADGSFGGSYFGGDKDDYDVVKTQQAWHQTEFTSDGADGIPDNADDDDSYARLHAATLAGFHTDAAYYHVQGLDPVTHQPDPNYERLVDVDNLIDYMITIYHSGDRDAPISNYFNNNALNNFFGMYNRENPDGWKWFRHDAEGSLDVGVEDRTGPWYGSNLLELRWFNPQSLHQELCDHPDYRMRFADRVYKFFFNGGALETDMAKASVSARAEQIDTAIMAESARWGDAKVATPHTKSTWENAVSDLKAFFDGRTATVIAQLQNDGWYPTLDPPIYNQHGGSVSSGFAVDLSAAGTIYYTLDGSDPRLSGGDIALGALVFTPGGVDDIVITEDTVVKARTLSGTTWSVLSEAAFMIGQPATIENLVVTEINYNPAPPTTAELAVDDSWTDNAFEFIELKNVGTETINLAGARFTVGIDYTFGNDVLLSPGQAIVVAADPQALAERYDTTGILVADGAYTGALDSNGERIRLDDATGNAIFNFSFNDGGSWPGRADGKGATLELLDPTSVPGGNAERTDYLDSGANWHASVRYGGTPGTDGDEAVGIVINEVLSHTDLPLVDSIELYNPTAEPIDVAGWYLSDDWGWDPTFDSGNYKKYRIPADLPGGTTIMPGGYLVFDETHFNPTPADPAANHFALDGAHGDDVWLMKADGSGNLTHFVAHAEFGAQANGESWGRWPNATGRLYPMTQWTPNGPNSGPRLGTVVISEVHYNPEVATDGLEFVEIVNHRGVPVDLTHWKLRGGVDFDFADGTTLGASETLVVVPFDPQNDSDQEAIFRTHHRITDDVVLVGPYDGNLDNGGEAVRLKSADEPPMEEPDFYPSLLEDEVIYDDVAPWPIEADGGGMSLNRVESNPWGNDPASWVADVPTPGNGEVVYPQCIWQGGDDVWTAANWNDDGTADQLPVIGNDMVIDLDESIVRVDQDVVSGGTGPAGAVEVGENQHAQLEVDATLEVSRDVYIGPNGTLSGTGTVQAGEGIEIEGTLAPGSSIGTLTAQGDVIMNGGSTMAVELSGSGTLVAGVNNDLLVADDLTLTGNPALELEWLAGKLDDGLFGGVYTIATYSGTLTGTFANPTLTADFNGADASVYIDTTYGTGGIDYGSGTNDAITVKLKDLLVGDANLDGDVDVFQIDGKGDAQVLSAHLGVAGGDGHDVGAQEAEALYNPATGELFFDVGENVSAVYVRATAIFPDNVDETSLFGTPIQNDGALLAYYDSTGLPVGEDSVGLVLPTGLAPADITFGYIPVGSDTILQAVELVGSDWSDGDFNFDGDVDVFQIDGKGDAQLLSANLGASLDIALEQAVMEEAAVVEPLDAALDWQYEFESTQSKVAKRRDVEATVDLLLRTGWS